jgi:hypothetical protein
MKNLIISFIALVQIVNAQSVYLTKLKNNDNTDQILFKINEEIKDASYLGNRSSGIFKR